LIILMKDVIYRQQIKFSDVEAISTIVRSSGFFSAEEIEIALELAVEKLEQQEASSYLFLFAEINKRVVGYTCYGFIPATHSSYDLYWIAVLQDFGRKGLGKLLMTKTEKLISTAGGKQIYVETSSRNQYQPTHNFYESCGYHQEAFLKNFYSEGDGKIIYVKTLK
jgi:ribosomal protein S18 acetylase RimI-like enzyme